MGFQYEIGFVSGAGQKRQSLSLQKLARAYFRKFPDLWKDADPGIP